MRSHKHRPIGCCHSVVSNDQRWRCLTFANGNKMCSLMNVFILYNHKGLGSLHCVPGQFFPHELHNGCIIRFLTWPQTFCLLLQQFVLCWSVYVNSCHFTTFCTFFSVDIFKVQKALSVLLTSPKYFVNKQVFILETFCRLSLWILMEDNQPVSVTLQCICQWCMRVNWLEGIRVSCLGKERGYRELAAKLRSQTLDIGLMEERASGFPWLFLSEWATVRYEDSVPIHILTLFFG